MSWLKRVFSKRNREDTTTKLGAVKAAVAIAAGTGLISPALLPWVLGAFGVVDIIRKGQVDDDKPPAPGADR